MHKREPTRSEYNNVKLRLSCYNKNTNIVSHQFIGFVTTAYQLSRLFNDYVCGSMQILTN
jgi:hypothetical protein